MIMSPFVHLLVDLADMPWWGYLIGMAIPGVVLIIVILIINA